MLNIIDRKLALDDCTFSCEFEEILPEAKWLPLPKEAQVIDYRTSIE